MSNLKKRKQTILERCLVAFCTVMAIISCVCTYIVIEQASEKQLVVNGDITDEDEEGKGPITGIIAEYAGSTCYVDTYVNRNAIRVYGLCENGSKKLLTNWEGELGPVVEGTNTFEIQYSSFTTTVDVKGTRLEMMSYAGNYKLYGFDTTDARKILMDIESNRVSYNEVFENVLFCGDSRTKALLGFNVLDKNLVLAENGVGLEHLDAYMQQVLITHPDTIILNYGVNSMSEYENGRIEFLQQYKELLQDIKRALPNTRIIVAAIFPVSDAFRVEQVRMYYIENVNLELMKMCVELEIEFINGSDLIYDNEFLLSEDGLHFTDQFYKEYWLKELIMEMGVGVVGKE